jgi:hypothetical protein
MNCKKNIEKYEGCGQNFRRYLLFRLGFIKGERNPWVQVLSRPILSIPGGR